LKLRSIRKVQDEPIDFSEGLGVHVLELLSLKDGLHEERSHLGDVAFLQLCL
jgi:hypothetical protein